MQKNLRSNIALEVSEGLIKNKDYIKSHKKISNNVSVDITEILTDYASKNYGLEKGTYVLLSMPFDLTVVRAEEDAITTQLANGINLLLKKSGIKNPRSVLVVGLGNPKLLADSFGSRVIDKVFATKAVMFPNFSENPKYNSKTEKQSNSNKNSKDIKLHKKLTKKDLGIKCDVCKFSCNVFGQNGIESHDIIKGVVDIVRPDLVVLIDTLVASSVERLCTNIQLANVGIIPGSGVDNARKELSQKTLKTKVITIGMPLVVYASDIVRQFLQKSGSGANLCKDISSKSQNYQNMVQDLQKIDDLIVMPREIEDQLSICSKMLARAINLAFNPNFLQQEFEKYFY